MLALQYLRSNSCFKSMWGRKASREKEVKRMAKLHAHRIVRGMTAEGLGAVRGTKRGGA
jgi:hypothetical protein